MGLEGALACGAMETALMVRGLGLGDCISQENRVVARNAMVPGARSQRWHCSVLMESLRSFRRDTLNSAVGLFALDLANSLRADTVFSFLSCCS